MSRLGTFRTQRDADLSQLCEQKRTLTRCLTSSIPCQLPASPMLVFPVGVEHALDVTV
jgi:hypothetical protein